jgi:hypothetical protein
MISSGREELELRVKHIKTGWANSIRTGQRKVPWTMSTQKTLPSGGLSSEAVLC